MAGSFTGGQATTRRADSPTAPLDRSRLGGEALVERHARHPHDLPAGLDHRQRAAQRARHLAVGEQVLERLGAAEPDRAHAVAVPPGAHHERARRPRSAATPHLAAAAEPRPRPPRRRSARRPARASSTGAGGGRVPAAPEAQRAVLHDRPQPVAEVERRRAAPPRRAPARHRPAARESERVAADASSASARSTSRASAGGQRAPGPRAPPPARRRARSSASADGAVEHLGLVAQQPRGLGDRSARPRATASRSAGRSSSRTRARAKRGSAFDASSRQVEAARAAVVARLLARDLQQRAHQPPAPRLHAQQRAAAGRDGQAVEHRLGLVGRGVGGRVVARGACRSASA